MALNLSCITIRWEALLLLILRRETSGDGGARNYDVRAMGGGEGELPCRDRELAMTDVLIIFQTAERESEREKCVLLCDTPRTGRRCRPATAATFYDVMPQCNVIIEGLLAQPSPAQTGL